MRRLRLALLVAVVAVLGSACGFSGLNSLPVPGAQGTGENAYQIYAVIPTAGGLVRNAPVMIDDATVGSVGGIAVDNWNAKLTIRLNSGVKVAQGSYVMVGLTSVLGSSHLEIVQPQTAKGYLRAGDQIPLPSCPKVSNLAVPETDRVPNINTAQQVPACSFPTTEQVLSSLSVVLNGGGLSQFGNIAHEMSAIFDGHQREIRALIPRVGTLVDDLDSQTANIISAMQGLDRLTASINEQTPTVEKALSDGPKILRLLNDQRQQLVTMLNSVGTLSATTNDILDANSEDIKVILANMSKAMRAFGDAGPALSGSLRILLTFPFLEETIPDIIKGDYVNSDLVLDLTIQKLQASIFRSVGVVGPEGVVGRPAGNAKRGLNPFSAPLQPGGETRSENDDPIPAIYNTPATQGGN